MPFKHSLAYLDIKGAIDSWRVWLLLGWQDIRLRYRRSYLGPWWITMSMLVTIMCLGFLYGKLFKMPIQEYLPYLAIGMVGWTFILTLVNEGASSLVESSPYLKQISLPYSVFILRILVRNCIIFFHNIIPVLLVLLLFQVKPTWALLWFIPGFFLIVLNGFLYAWILAIIGARYRDIQPIISSLMQIAFFVTPIIWLPSVLPEKYRYLVDLNPFAQFLELIRQPLLGHAPSTVCFLMVGMVTLIGFLAAAYLLNRTRKRIIYWL